MKTIVASLKAKASRHPKLFSWIAVVIAALGLRLLFIDAESIWMDEDLQAGRALQVAFNLDLVEKAAQQQQPPLDYYVQGVFLKLLGTTTFAARIHAAVFGALSAGVFVLLLLHLFGSRKVTWLGTAIFITHPYLIRYSQEGRPVSCGIFFGLLYLYVSVTRVFGENESPRRRLSFLALLLTQVAFLLSVGFQPVVFIAAAVAGLLPFFFVKKYRVPIFIHLVSSVAALICAWPVLSLTVKNGGHYLKNGSLDGLLKNVFARLRPPNPGEVFEKISALAGDALPIWGAIAAFGLVGLIGVPLYSALRKLPGTPGKDRCSPNIKRLTLYATIVFVVFLALFDVAFHAFISYRIVLRYYMSAAPLFILLGVLSVHCAGRSWSTPLLGDRVSRISKVLLSLLCLSICLVQLNETASKVYATRENADWRGMYDLFKKNTERPARAYMMNLVKIDRYHPYFFARRFYYTDRPAPASLADGFKLPRDSASSKFVKSTSKVFVCTMYGSNRVSPRFFNSLTAVHVHRFTSMAVAEIDGGENLRRNVLAFFRKFAKYAEVKEGNYKLFSILFELEHQDRNFLGMKAALKKLDRMDKRGKLAGRIRSYRKKLKQLKKENGASVEK